MLRKFRIAWGLTRREKIWLCALFLISALARAALLWLPFSSIAPFLGKRHGNISLSPLVRNSELRLARRIGALAGLIARHTPWQCKCLAQALMVKTLLDHYRIPYALYLGVAKAPSGTDKSKGFGKSMIAHAWVAVGPRVISGFAGHEAYSVVSTYVSPALLQGNPNR